MEKEKGEALAPGDIVQIGPDKHPIFGGCFVVVTKVRVFGIQGYIQSITHNGGLAYCRFEWADFVPTGGKAVWWQKEEEDDD